MHSPDPRGPGTCFTVYDPCTAAESCQRRRRAKCSARARRHRCHRRRLTLSGTLFLTRKRYENGNCEHRFTVCCYRLTVFQTVKRYPDYRFGHLCPRQAEEEKLRAAFSAEDLAARIAAWPNCLCARVLHAWWEVRNAGERALCSISEIFNGVFSKFSKSGCILRVF